MTIEEAVLVLKRYQGYEPMEDGIHTSWVKGQDGNMVLKYCVKCGAVFAVKEGGQDG